MGHESTQQQDKQSIWGEINLRDGMPHQRKDGRCLKEECEQHQNKTQARAGARLYKCVGVSTLNAHKNRNTNALCANPVTKTKTKTQNNNNNKTTKTKMTTRPTHRTTTSNQTIEQ